MSKGTTKRHDHVDPELAVRGGHGRREGRSRSWLTYLGLMLAGVLAGVAVSTLIVDQASSDVPSLESDLLRLTGPRIEPEPGQSSDIGAPGGLIQEFQEESYPAATGPRGLGGVTIRWEWSETPDLPWPDPPPSVELRRSGESPGETLSARLTDAKGSIDLEAGPGEWDLVVVGLGFDIWSMGIDVGESPVTWDLDAAALPSLGGYCVDESGRGVENTLVTLTPVRLGRNIRESVSTRTGAKGEFVIPVLPREPFYTLAAVADGYASARVDHVFLESPKVNRAPNLVLEKAWKLSGVVQDGGGIPIAQCPVVASGQGRTSRAISGADGRFVMPSVPAVELLAWTEDRSRSNVRRTIPAKAADREVTLVLESGAWVDGTIRFDDGSSPEGLRLWGFPRGPDAKADEAEFWGFRRDATCNGPEGSFRIGPFPAGPVELFESSKSLSRHMVQAPSTVELVLPAPYELFVTLILQDDDTLEPIRASGHVGIRWTNGVQQGGVARLSISSNSKGEVELVRVVPKHAAIAVAIDVTGYTPVEIPDLAAATQGGSTCVVRLKKPAVLVVQLKDSQQQAVAEANVTVVWQCSRATLDTYRRAGVEGMSGSDGSWFEGSSVISFSGVSDAKGEVQVPCVGETGLVILVNAPGFAPVVHRLASAPNIGKDSSLTAPDVSLQLDRLDSQP